MLRASQPRRLGPDDILSRYYDAPGVGDMRILAFANSLADYYLSTAIPRERHRIEELNLSTFINGSLRRAGFEFIDEIEHLNERQLRMIRNIGPHGVLQIHSAIAQFRSSRP